MFKKILKFILLKYKNIHFCNIVIQSLETVLIVLNLFENKFNLILVKKFAFYIIFSQGFLRIILFNIYLHFNQIPKNIDIYEPYLFMFSNFAFLKLPYTFLCCTFGVLFFLIVDIYLTFKMSSEFLYIPYLSSIVYRSTVANMLPNLPIKTIFTSPVLYMKTYFNCVQLIFHSKNVVFQRLQIKNNFNFSNQIKMCLNLNLILKMAIMSIILEKMGVVFMILCCKFKFLNVCQFLKH